MQAVQSSMAEGATALASMQRMVEERTQQASSAQQALMQAQQEQANLTARLHTAQDQAALRWVHPIPCSGTDRSYLMHLSR